MSEIKISVVIVAYKAKDLLKRCLKSIPKDKGIEVVVIDNTFNNRGFAKGVNLGVSQARGEYLFILNPDCELFEDTLKNLETALKVPGVMLVGPQLVDSDGQPYLSYTDQPTRLSAWIVYSFIGKWWKNNKYSRQYWQIGTDLNKRKEVESISGAAMMIRRQDYINMGGFDERYFMYWEDYDLCRRILMINKKIVFEPKAKLKHVGGGSTGPGNVNTKRWFKQARLKFFQKHWGRIYGLLLEGFLRIQESI